MQKLLHEMPLCSTWYLWQQERLPMLCSPQNPWKQAQVPLNSPREKRRIGHSKYIFSTVLSLLLCTYIVAIM